MTARTRYNVVSFIHCVYIYLCILCWTPIVYVQGCIHSRDRRKSSDSSQKGGNEYKSIWTEYHERKGETVKFRFKKIEGLYIESLQKSSILHIMLLLDYLGMAKYKRRSAAAAGLSTAACHWWFMTPSTPHTHFLGLLLLLYIYIYIYVLYRDFGFRTRDAYVTHISYFIYNNNPGRPAALCHYIHPYHALPIYILYNVGYMPGEWLCNASDKPQKHISQNEMSLFFIFSLFFYGLLLLRSPLSVASFQSSPLYILYISI